MKTLSETHRHLLIHTMAAVDALWLPYRFTKPADQAAVAVFERRERFARRGIPLIIGGSAAQRQAGYTEIHDLEFRGLVRLVGRDRNRGVLFTRHGDNYVRSMVPTNRIDQAWPALRRVAETQKRFCAARNSGYVVEFTVLRIRDTEDPETYTKKLHDFEDEALPLLAAGLLDAFGDTKGRIGYRTTKLGDEALAAGKPRAPKGMPEYDPADGEKFINIYTEMLEARSSWVPAHSNQVVVPLSAGTWPELPGTEIDDRAFFRELELAD